MRTFWDEAARTNAVWYVDTSLSFDNPDLDRFFETGRRIVAEALDRSPVPVPATRLAVEIGSGLGRVCLALAERKFDRIVGIDISPEMVRRARELVTDERVTFEVGTGSTLEAISDGTADVVLSFTVFQHIPDVEVIEGYISEAGRILRPGGLIVFQWNNQPRARWWAWRRQVLAFAQRIGLGRERYGRNAAEFLGSRVSLGRISSALERAGLTLRGTSELGTLYAWAWAERNEGAQA